jgi:hypothetical protein
MTAYTNEGHPTSGTTAQRPSNAQPGFRYYDTDLGQELVKTGASGTNTWATILTLNPPATVAVGGTAQANANAIGTGFTKVTGADGTAAIRLPEAAANQVCIIKNVANNVLKVFPAANDSVNAGTANAVFNMTNLTSVMLIAFDDVNWTSLPLLPS